MGHRRPRETLSMYEEESNALGLVILLCGGLFIGCCAAVACFLGLEEILRSLT